MEETKKESLLQSKQVSSLYKNKSGLCSEEAKRLNPELSFYYQNGEEIVPIKIPMQVYSVRDAIERGVEAVNTQYGLSLLHDYQLYQLYVAKKTGKKKSDLPALEYTQLVEKTKFEHFCIIPKKDAVVVEVAKPPIKNLDIAPVRQKKASIDLKTESNSPKLQFKQPSSTETFTYISINSEIMPKSQSKKQIVAEPASFGCFCFTKRR